MELAERIWGQSSLRKDPGEEEPYFRLSISGWKLEMDKSWFGVYSVCVLACFLAIGLTVAFVTGTVILGIFMVLVGILVVGLWYFVGVLR